MPSWLKVLSSYARTGIVGVATFKGFLVRFTRVLFFLALLDVGEVGILGAVLLFLWVFKGFKQIYIRIFIKRGKWVSISRFLENQPNQIGIKLVNWTTL